MLFPEGLYELWLWNFVATRLVNLCSILLGLRVFGSIVMNIQGNFVRRRLAEYEMVYHALEVIRMLCCDVFSSIIKAVKLNISSIDIFFTSSNAMQLIF